MKTERKLQNDEVLKLIKLYRGHEVLWNMSQTGYRHNERRKAAYEEIARAMSMSTEGVRRKLKALRGTYLLENKKIEQSKKFSDDPNDEFVPSIFWYSKMKFLNASIIARSKKSKRHNSNNTCNEDEMQSVGNAASDESREVPTKRRKTIEVAEKAPLNLDELLVKLLEKQQMDNDVYTLFAGNIAAQLRTLPEADAYTAMAEFQNIVAQKKLNHLSTTMMEKQHGQCVPQQLETVTKFHHNEDTPHPATFYVDEITSEKIY